MSFRLPSPSREDVGATPRRKMTPTRALRIWEAKGPTCCLCGLPIDGIKDEWFIEHPKSLAMGGSDKDEDLAPAHYSCKPAKDAEDAAKLAKARSNKKRHLGIKPAPARKLQGLGFEKHPKTRMEKPPALPRRSIYEKVLP